MRYQQPVVLKAIRAFPFIAVAVIATLVFSLRAVAQDTSITARLDGFDAYMEQVLKDWNAPGIGVGIVVGDSLVFAKGYGFRDYGQKLPFTPQTQMQIASNTKLFTAVAAGLLVEEGKLSWDRPVRESVPSIQFYNDELNASVTLRDMLAHRTGITRHDLIWYRSDDTRPQLFEKIRFLEPKEPLRTLWLYNNMMYIGVGQIIELQSGKTWEEFVRERIFTPLEMNRATYAVADMLKQPDYSVPFTERRDSFELYQIPYYEDAVAVGPAGAIIANIEELSHWLICLMNDGQYKGRQIIPPGVLDATLEPAIHTPNTTAEAYGYWEIMNPIYGMARWTASYRGHLLAYHGGDIDGFHSQVSMLPLEGIGVIVFVIGDHCASLYNTITYNVYERLLGMSQTPWSERRLEARLKSKEEGAQARAKAGSDRVRGTKPSHALKDYSGVYEHSAYGAVNITLPGKQLQFDFRRFQMPLSHYHYDRFDTPDDERFGRWSVSFLTNPQGDVDRLVMSLDEGEVTFTRRPAELDPQQLALLAGVYESASGYQFQAVLREGDGLYLILPGEPEQKLIPYKGLQFRIPEFSDITLEFVLEGGKVTSLIQRDPSGEHSFVRK